MRVPGVSIGIRPLESPGVCAIQVEGDHTNKREKKARKARNVARQGCPLDA
jgi:hypothetical protein